MAKGVILRTFVFLMVVMVKDCSSESYKCPGYGRFLDPSVADCKGYYLCTQDDVGEDIVMKFTCPSTSIFNSGSSKCEYLDISSCENYKATPTEEILTHEEISEHNKTQRSGDEVFRCSENGKFNDPSDKTCSNYYFCYEHEGIWEKKVYTCPNNTYFDPISRFCSNAYICPDANSKTDFRSSSKIGNGSSNLDPLKQKMMDDIVERISVLTRTFTCTNTGKFADPSVKDCSKYIFCIERSNSEGYVPLQYDCPVNTFFDPSKQFCSTDFKCNIAKSSLASTTNTSYLDTGDVIFETDSEMYLQKNSAIRAVKRDDTSSINSNHGASRTPLETASIEGSSQTNPSETTTISISTAPQETEFKDTREVLSASPPTIEPTSDETFTEPITSDGLTQTNPSETTTASFSTTPQETESSEGPEISPTSLTTSDSGEISSEQTTTEGSTQSNPSETTTVSFSTTPQETESSEGSEISPTSLTTSDSGEISSEQTTTEGSTQSDPSETTTVSFSTTLQETESSEGPEVSYPSPTTSDSTSGEISLEQTTTEGSTQSNPSESTTVSFSTTPQENESSEGPEVLSPSPTTSDSTSGEISSERTTTEGSTQSNPSESTTVSFSTTPQETESSEGPEVSSPSPTTSDSTSGEISSERTTTEGSTQINPSETTTVSFSTTPQENESSEGHEVSSPSPTTSDSTSGDISSERTTTEGSTQINPSETTTVSFSTTPQENESSEGHEVSSPSPTTSDSTSGEISSERTTTEGSTQSSPSESTTVSFLTTPQETESSEGPEVSSTRPTTIEFTSNETSTKSPTTEYTTETGSPIFTCRKPGRFPNPYVAGCTGYILCSNTATENHYKETHFGCPGKTIFDPNTSKCTLLSKYSCPSDDNPNVYNCKVEGRFPTSNPDCQNYILCLPHADSFKSLMLSCPENTKFDPVIKACSRSYRCPPKGTTTVSPSFTCPASGKYLDPQSMDCKRYILCYETYYGLEQMKFVCPGKTTFDEHTKICSGINLFCPNNPNIEFNQSFNRIKPEQDLVEQPENSFQCEKPGRFPDLSEPGCKSYILCVYAEKNNTFSQLRYNCTGSSVFDPIKLKCVSDQYVLQQSENQIKRKFIKSK